MYAAWFINSVEYQDGKRRYPWSVADRQKFSERDLAEALNEAYEKGRRDVAREFAELALQFTSGSDLGG